MSLAPYLNKKVCVMTADSRILVGELSSYDTQTNLVLLKAVERVIRSQDDDEASSEVPMGGLYIVRGDNVCTVGLVEVELDNSIDWKKVKGEAIGGIKHI
ncbi:Sm-like ribonucleoprotein [Apiospora marii]|uniref:LSM2-LSM8 complex subunit LSM8 n=1 Tax=Apiospora marii TaxID=335849 RepID=A0ABR1RTU1_9PEZI